MVFMVVNDILLSMMSSVGMRNYASIMFSNADVCICES